MQKHHLYLLVGIGLHLLGYVPGCGVVGGPGLGVAVAGAIDWYWTRRA